MSGGPGNRHGLKSRRHRQPKPDLPSSNDLSRYTQVRRPTFSSSPQGCRRELRMAAWGIALTLIIGSLVAFLQSGLGVAALTSGVLAMLILSVLVYFSPLPQKLKALLGHEQTAKRRQARHHQRHQRKVNRLFLKIGHGYHLGADGEIVEDKPAQHAADSDHSR